MYQDQIIIDGLQYCRWDREYFLELQESGITAVHVTLVYHETIRETLSRFGEWNKLFENNKDLITPIGDATVIPTIKKEGRVGIFFGAQNCSPIEADISLVEILRNLGLLIMQLTYNNQSLLATGCFEEEDGGITRFGQEVIKEMNRIGMIIDMSHSSEKSTLQAMEYSSRPICISHANPDFIHPAKRNKSKTVLKSLAEQKGILGFSLYPFHLPHQSECTLEYFCIMVAKTAELIGVDALGIGSDLCLHQPQEVLDWMRNGKWSRTMNYGEGSSSNASWPDPLPWFDLKNGMKNIYEGLLKVGFNNDEVNQIMGGNWFEFLKTGLSSMSSQETKKSLKKTSKASI